MNYWQVAHPWRRRWRQERRQPLVRQQARIYRSRHVRSRHVSRHVYRRVYRHVYRHVYGRVYGRVYRHVYRHVSSGPTAAATLRGDDYYSG